MRLRQCDETPQVLSDSQLPTKIIRQLADRLSGFSTLQTAGSLVALAIVLTV